MISGNWILDLNHRHGSEACCLLRIVFQVSNQKSTTYVVGKFLLKLGGIN